jgi:small subunit ribosomal protein S4
MGDPRHLRKKFRRPSNPFEKTRIEAELKVVGEYGLRNKREFWKHKYQLSRFREIARTLRSLSEDAQKIGYKEIGNKLSRLGLTAENPSTDDILSLSSEDILNRRLQTLVYKKGLARTIYQARQFVTHKHITVGGRIVSAPSYLVTKSEEQSIAFEDFSPFKGNSDKIFSDKNQGQDASGKKGRGRGKRTEDSEESESESVAPKGKGKPAAESEESTAPKGKGKPAAESEESAAPKKKSKKTEAKEESK